MPSPSTHSPKPPMKSAIATITPSAPESGTCRSASIAYERPRIRGTIPHCTLSTSPANANRVWVGIGGRMPYTTEKPAISGSTRLRSASFHQSSWSSRTLSGCSAATSRACEKSFERS